MSSVLSAELAATCSALGYYDAKSNKYYADENTLETVKDLIRYLRRDDESHDVRRHLGETKIVETDLLPLLRSYWEEAELFDVLLRLLVNLTTPALMLWNEELPAEKSGRHHYLQIQDHLMRNKEAFADETVWAALSSRLSRILEIDPAERGDENSLIIERILILIRNILYVPPDPNLEKRPDNDASIHDQVLWALHQSGMLDIILYISSSANEKAYYMHTLEILSFMLREQKASELAQAALQRSETEKLRDEAELLAIRHGETYRKKQKAKTYNATRHSRFGGAYTIKSLKSINDDNDLIFLKPLSQLDSLTFDGDKKKSKTPKNRRPVQGATFERRSAFSIRLFLKEFCVEFVNGAYNTLMHHVKDNLVRQKAQDHDESYYLWALRFFMEFNRCYKFQVKLVSETMSIQSFHFVQQQMEHHYDMIASDKKKCVLWSRRLHLALLAYRELLMSICAMDKSGDAGVRESAKVIKSNIFYVVEYRELVITLLVMYDELKMSNAYLKDLIETQHVFVKMLESFCGGGGSGNSLIVQKKSRGGKKKRKAAAATAPQDPSSQEDLNLESRWDDDVAPQLSGILEGNIDFHGEENVVVPFDAASDVPIDEQRSDAMKNVQRKLRDGEFENAVSLLRAAREVWPENDCFGSSNMTPEEEFMALRDIFFANLGVDCDRPTSVQEQPIYGDDDEEEDEDDPHTVNYSEADFDFKDFCARLTNPKIVRACGLALQTFDTNSVNTNHCIVKLLHRVAFDCKMYVMLFQVSMFRSFQKIYARKEFPQYKELVKFATYVVRQFIKVAETNKKVYIEALFWKNNKEAYDIEHGYGKYQEQHQKGAGAAWSEEQEDELRRLFMEHRENRVQDDVVDWIVNNLIDNTRSRRAVLKKLKEMCLVVAPVGGGNPRGTSSRSWGAEEETQLRELFEQFKDATDPMACIMDGLEVRRSKARILDKLMVMGLIQDKKEMRKKRVRGTAAAGKSRRRRSGSSDGGSTATDSGSDSDGGVSSRRTNPSTTAKPKKKPARPSAKKSGATPANNKSRQAFTQASKRRMVELVLKVIASEMSEALEWLKECFEDAVEDFDPEVSGIPLVPILDSSIEAMDKPEFHELLKAVGVCEPFDEQETYWRIPGDIPLQNLKDTLELLKKGVDDQLTLDDEPKEPQLVASGSEDDDYVFNSLRTGSSVPTQQDLANSGGIPIEQNPDSDEDQPNSDGQRSDQEESQEQPQKRKQKKKRVQMLESDDETQLVIDLDEAESNTQESGTETQLEETEAQLEETETQLEESETQLDKTQADMSPNERGKNNKKRILDSDGEEEEEQDESTSWNVKQKKTRHILDSSDEEEESGKRGNATENSSPPAKRGKYVLSDDDDD